ncbi:MAG: transketolase [Candidatus Omnitrophica bacterium]|nr:transketolase [Candidatus Omnitrophota bacterium]
MVPTSQQLAKIIRSHALKMVHQANASHIGSCLSIADILAVLYNKILRVDSRRSDWPERDRFILSKGHAAAILYAVLAEKGFFPKEWLKDYCKDGALLTGHISHHVPGVEVSTGSLGHGLPIACGMALAAKRDGKPYRVFALLSDGELDEGSNWEAILFAGHHQLDNLTVIVDYNKIQSFGTVKDVLNLEPLAEKWKSFGWSVREINGHDFETIETTLGNLPFEQNRPSVVIAHTVKGKGISFMENKLEWHYKSPKDEQLKDALNELEKES